MSLINDLKKILPQASGRLKSDVAMSGHTTFKIGGPADIFFEPEQADEIIAILHFCRTKGISCQVIGNGSNILVSDAGIRGVVLSIGDRFSGMNWQDGLLQAKAGTKLSAVTAFAVRQGYAGLEFASGIPGTLGGAIFMNAGAYDHCMAETVAVTDYVDENLSISKLRGAEHQFSYRESFFLKHDCVILQSELMLVQDDPDTILSRMADLACRRKASQPLDLPSAGSAFKRPAGSFAGTLISECGLKGCRFGDAQVSEKHAGFIVNLGKATADDVRQLIEQVQEAVVRRTGIYLEPEIRFAGDWRHWTGVKTPQAGELAADRPIS